MIVGLCGAHGAGKTTLATEFVMKAPDYRFVPTSVGAIMRAAGFDPAADYPLGERIAIQFEILDRLDALYAAYSSNAVFDRTPLDTAAYLLADVRRQNVTPEHQKRIVKYVESAILCTNRRFGLLLFLPAVLPPVQREDKAPATPGYVEHISQLINGLRHDERVTVKHLSMPRAYTDLELRVDAVKSTVGKVMDHFQVDAAVIRGFNMLH